MAPERLNAEHVSRLQQYNPELELLYDLVGAMKVHLSEGFKTNGLMPQTERRPIYETVVWPVAWEPTGLFCLRLLPK
jgi:hypothetical protein